MKKSGFAVKITAFIEADPKSMESMNGAMQSISLIGEAFTTHCFRDLKLDSRFMLSKDIPDEPKAAEAHGLAVAGDPISTPINTPTPMPPIPAAMKRT